MPSLQEPAPGAKSAKFVAANPLEPMVKPFEETNNNDENATIQQALVDNVNERLQKAMEDLKDKHRRGVNEVDHEDRAPTGPAYRQIQQQKAMQQQSRQQEQERQLDEERRELERVQQQAKQRFQNDDDDAEDTDDDSDYDDLLEGDDPVLDAIRQKRLQEMRQVQIQKAEDLARGHGQYRTIAETDFLPECTGSSEFVAVHFFHNEFQRCKIMDHHLKIIAPLHTACKFLRIDAEKTPFFVAKLQIKMLPTLIVFREGKATARLTGFDGLSKDPKDPDTWETRRLQEWLAETGAISYTPSKDELREDMERLGLRRNGYVRRGGVEVYDEDY